MQSQKKINYYFILILTNKLWNDMLEGLDFVFCVKEGLDVLGELGDGVVGALGDEDGAVEGLLLTLVDE